ncbi:MAG: tyrosine transporter [Chlamydiae bacterium]|nr:tyrosine transporter [Chlamydiota bacterium]
MNLRNNRFIGGILLVAGTAIGAGMLAIPVITSFAGFFPSLLLLALVWLFLYLTARLLLDVNLASPGQVNFISMVGRTLGPFWKGICWVIYLLLLYSLTAAYISGSASFFQNITYFLTGWEIPFWVKPFPLLIFFGIFIYLGTKSVDRINRILMIGLIASYFFLIAFLPPYIDTSLFTHSDSPTLFLAVPVIITAFGFHIIIPTLTTYLNHDAKVLRLTILIGSLIPFVVYVIWEFLTLGTIPVSSLQEAYRCGESAINPLVRTLQIPSISFIAQFFSFFAIVTSFLGVSLSLSDFLTDGLKMRRYSFGREMASLLTFVPPLIFVYAYPRGFLLALEYAGFFVAILLCIFPALMAWKLPKYRSFSRRFFLCSILLISFFVIGLSILDTCSN